MKDDERGFKIRIVQIRVEGCQLRSRKHPLVYYRATRKRWNVESVIISGSALNLFSYKVEQAFALFRIIPFISQHRLSDARHCRSRLCSESIFINWNRTPAVEVQLIVLKYLFRNRATLLAQFCILREEKHANRQAIRN